MKRGATVHLVEQLELSVSRDRFRRAFPARGASSFVLEGGASPELDRVAFMGAEPVATLRASRTGARTSDGRVHARVVVSEAASRRCSTLEVVDPFDALRDLIAEHRPPGGVVDDAFPFPFRGGAVGYIGYECGQILERMPCRARPSVGMPDMAFGIYDWIIATCKRTGASWLSVFAASREEAETTRDRVVSMLAGAGELRRASSPRAEAAPVRAVLSRDEYIARVVSAKEHITAGDAFEICLTNAVHGHLARDDAWSLFDQLQRTNPAPFAAFVDLPEGAIVSSSPERFLAFDPRSRVAESRPIKGTRPRGVSPDEDARLARDLASSEKDRAENTMIVDLVRNDLGKVCRFGSVEVPAFHVVEPYATVHQLVSTVRGTLSPDRDGLDLVRACFPPGSMTGAPKIEAMSILEHLEPVERGVYSGALGWIDFEGGLDLSVVIRTIVLKDDVATFSVGGAIVADSSPAGEHEETEHKARALVDALGAVASRAVDRDEARKAAEIAVSP